MPSRPSARPAPKPGAVSSSAPDTPAAVALRAVNAAQEAEDQARHELKDNVDAKLMAWKGGKETNIRALLASLENVLWQGLRWQKVGMHELVTQKQVKGTYTRAIGRVHPDKVSCNALALVYQVN